jgi:predicted phage-related endonuclease
MKDINMIFSELAQYTRIMEEAAATVESLKDEIKAYMTESGVDVLTGNEHKATYKSVTSSRLDSKALKQDMPDIAAAYTRTTETKRFTFN